MELKTEDLNLCFTLLKQRTSWTEKDWRLRAPFEWKKIKVLVNFLNKLELRKGWTIEDWENNDKDGLETIQKLMPAKYQEMYDQFYKKSQ